MNKFTVTGKCSEFGGPQDHGVGPTEGLALIERSDLNDPRFAGLFLSASVAGADGLARRLNPQKHYLACRWWETELSRSFLRNARFRVSANGRSHSDVQAVDAGPNVRTGRVADLSPGLARDLGVDTDDEVTVELIDAAPAPVPTPAPLPGEPASSKAAALAAIWNGRRFSDCRVKCTAIRGGLEKGADNRLGIYDDLFLLQRGDRITIWKGSTDPGQYFIDHPINAKGCAQLKEGTHLFEVGVHRGQWAAFVQAESFHVNRLDDRGRIVSVESGDFAIHLHSGGPGVDVGHFSAGCQVIWSPEGYFGETWHRFYDPAVAAMKEAGQRTFPYALLSARDLAPEMLKTLRA